jgi:predicted ATPase/DNA-binding XRE family transcriptional regulator
MDNRFGSLLREYRLAARLSQEALAERAAMSVNGISALERGANQSPQRKTLDLLVEALSLDWERARALERAAARPSRPRLAAKRVRFNGLPRALTPFFGREHTIAEVRRLVLERPLVTLNGPGGIGKTRIALKVAEELANRFSDGTHFIDLIAGERLLTGLVEKLGSKNVLIVLDNCEHLAETVAATAQAIIAACPGVRIIATSRQALKVPGEQLFRVPPLETDAAVKLFQERAHRALGPREFSAADVDVIARIVVRLDGIALAIELAAARMNLLTIADLEHHLNERFDVLTGGSTMALPRHQTMRATMDWSYELLTEREREIFCRLSIFPASFSLDAAVAVCGDDRNGKWHIFEALASLIDKSLVNSAPDGSVQRYRLLETTRAYAAERIGEPELFEALHQCHAAYFAGVAERAASAFDSTESTTSWARALEPDLENFRAALNYTLQDRGDTAAGVRLLSNLQELWIVQGLAAQAERRAQDALSAEPQLADRLQAELWLTIARMRQELFVHPGQTLEAASHARALFEASGDRNGLALAVRQTAAAHMRLGARAQARREFEESVSIYRELGDRRMAARGLGYLASLLQVQGEYREARALLIDVLHTARSVGDDRMIPTISMNLAETEFALGDFESAANRARKNVEDETLRKSCDMMATQQANLSVYLLALGRMKEARSAALASLEEASGSFIAVPIQHLAAGIAESDPASAAKMLGYVDETFKTAGFSRENTERFSRDYLMASLRASIDEGAIEQYHREGAAMNEKEILKIIAGR